MISLSLRTKLFLLVGAAVACTSLPYMLYEHNTLVETAMRREARAFANTAGLVRDSLETRFLSILSTRAEHVLSIKEQLQRLSEFSADLLKGEGNAADFIRTLNATVNDSGVHAALYDNNARPVVTDPMIASLVKKNRKDMRGTAIKDRIIFGGSGYRYSIVNLDDKERYTCIFLCLKPVSGWRTLVLACPFEQERSRNEFMRDRLSQNMQERLNELRMDGESAISIFSADGSRMASTGRAVSLDDIDRDVLENAKKYGRMEGVTSDDTPDVFHVEYFKAMDWYIVALMPLSAVKKTAQGLTSGLAVLSLAVLVCSLLAMVFFADRLTRPLRMLTETAGRIAAADLSAAGTLSSEGLSAGLPSGTDEVGRLGQSFASMLAALENSIRSLMETNSVRNRMQGELNAARDIQMGILTPPAGLPAACGLAAWACLEPAKEVGGDLYDSFSAPDGRQAIVVGDVSDKGVPAALFMSMTVTLVRSLLHEGLSPALAMARVNDQLAANNPSCMFVTLFIGLLDTASGIMTFANGGHCPPMVVPADGGAPVRVDRTVTGPLVGALPGAGYADAVMEIAPGETVLLYTDGVSECMNSEKELFEEKRILQSLDGLRGLQPKDVVEGVMHNLAEWRGDAPQSDDITMLCFSRTLEK